MLTAFREAIRWLEERENFEQVKEWFDSTSRCTDFTLTSVLYLPCSCYLSFLFYLLPRLCSLFPFLLLPLFPILPVTSPLFSISLPPVTSHSILPVTSLACFTCYISFLFYLLLAYFTCYLSFFFYLLHLFPILLVTSLVYFTC